LLRPVRGGIDAAQGAVRLRPFDVREHAAGQSVARV
jgi:hypothetical protein